MPTHTSIAQSDRTTASRRTPAKHQNVALRQKRKKSEMATLSAYQLPTDITHELFFVNAARFN
jgi:hypothetical protein